MCPVLLGLGGPVTRCFEDLALIRALLWTPLLRLEILKRNRATARNPEIDGF
jgi:hypothetical protein